MFAVLYPKAKHWALRPNARKSENANDKESCVTTGGGTNNKFTVENAERLREMYEATLAVYIRFVGGVDEYEGTPLSDPNVAQYRKEILADGGYVEALDRWRAVQGVTLSRFRDGTMDVYIPLDDSEFSVDDYGEVLEGCVPRDGDGEIDKKELEEREIRFQDGAFLVRYAKMDCVLGTVFQDQAYFSLRRENADLTEPLDVLLACGYALDNTFDCADASQTERTCELTDVKVFHPDITNTEGSPPSIAVDGLIGCRPQRYSFSGGLSVLPDITVVAAEFSRVEGEVGTCTITFDDAWERYQFNLFITGNPKPRLATLEAGEDSAIFRVPRPVDFPFDVKFGDVKSNIRAFGGRVRCSVDEADEGVYGAGMSTDTVTVSDVVVTEEDTFHRLVRDALRRIDEPEGDKPLFDFKRTASGVAESRVDKVAHALFYTYVWGWYTLLIEMPYYSIQDLLSHPPVSLSASSLEITQDIQQDKEVLQRYRLLSSLFADPEKEEFQTKNFGFLTPQEALDAYEDSYDSRFSGYLGRALGRFLSLVPRSEYR